MSATDLAASPDRSPGPTAEAMRVAFRELHGRRLHAFALLLTLGERAAAARLASDALAAGSMRIDELRHPERAAAWLRRWVVEGAHVTRNEPADRRALAELGVDGPVVDGFATLGRLERAALIASAVERLDRRDVASIVGRGGPALDRLLRRARGGFIRVHASAARNEEPRDGPIAARVRQIAQRTMT